MAKKIIKNLPVPLTDDEKIRYGQEVGRAAEELHEMERMAKESAKAHKDKMDKQKVRISALSSILATGIEHRDIECEQRMYYGEGMVRIYRTDTMKLLEERKMTPQETQMEIEVIVNDDDTKHRSMES